MADLRAAAKQALEFVTSKQWGTVPYMDGNVYSDAKELEGALRAALAQDEPDAYGYASRLAVAIWEKHYKDAAPQWKPLDDLMGVLTQIDNMTSGLTRQAQQAEPVQEPVAWMRPDNRVAEESYSRTQFSRGRDKPPIGTWTPLYTAPQQQAEPVQFDLAEAMNLADNYASAQSEMDSEHSVNRQYYVQSRNEERAKLASYLGIKGGGNG